MAWPDVFARDSAGFGKGEPEGIIAPETADHAAGTSAMLPMLALGIPGSATAAVMMGGLMIWGLIRARCCSSSGPIRLGPDREDVRGERGGGGLVLFTVPLFAAILRIPFAIVAP